MQASISRFFAPRTPTKENSTQDDSMIINGSGNKKVTHDQAAPKKCATTTPSSTAATHHRDDVILGVSKKEGGNSHMSSARTASVRSLQSHSSEAARTDSDDTESMEGKESTLKKLTRGSNGGVVNCGNGGEKNGKSKRLRLQRHDSDNDEEFKDEMHADEGANRGKPKMQPKKMRAEESECEEGNDLEGFIVHDSEESEEEPLPKTKKVRWCIRGRRRGAGG